MAGEEITYSKLERCIWDKEKFKSLSDDGKLLYLYIITNPHNNLIGFYVLKPGYACEDLGWDRERFTKGLGELLTKPLIEYDEVGSVILDLNQLAKFPLQNPNQVKSAISKMQALPKNKLFQSFAEMLKRLDKPLYKPLQEQLGKRLGKPVTVSVTVKGLKEYTFPLSKEQIEEASILLIDEWLDALAEHLYRENIFPEAPQFKNTMIANGHNFHHRAVLHAMNQWLKKENKKGSAWGYCFKTLEMENALYNERDATRSHT